MKYEEKVSEGRLLGFRSGKLYKKIFSVIYIIFAALISAGFLFTIKDFNEGLITAEVIISLFAPYIFLSDFKLRYALPLFKKRKGIYSFLGLICVYILISVIFTLLNPALYA